VAVHELTLGLLRVRDGPADAVGQAAAEVLGVEVGGSDVLPEDDLAALSLCLHDDPGHGLMVARRALPVGKEAVTSAHSRSV